MSVIHPYTVAGLRLYARVKNCEQFCETADVLEAWQRLVAVMNVRGPGQDRRWHDRYRCVLRPGVQPGTFDDQSEANLEFLLQMSDIFKGMAEDGNHGRGHKVNRLATPTASALHITCNALVASCRDLLNLNIEGVEYVAMGKANSDPTEHSFGKRRVMCGTNYWTSVQAFMVSNRLSQKLHLINLVGFLPQHIQEDLQLAKDKEKEEDTAILTELAEELMEEDRNPPTDPLVVASIGNYAGYLAKKVQSKGSVASCCKEELCEEQGDITVENSGTEATDKFTALTDLVDRRSIQDGSNVLQRPALPMAHMASFGMMVWDSLMCCEENRERRVKFLSLTMQHADAFGYLIGVLAEAESALKEYRCQEGHLLVRTVLPHIARSLFNGFGSNLAKDVTSEARKNKLSVPGGRRREHDGDDGGSSKSVMDRETYKRSKVTSAYKS